jgi:trigger factor
LLNLTEEKIGPCLVAIEVDVDAERVDSAMHVAAKRVSRTARIPGFRPGKAPYAVILRTYGRDALLHEAVDDLGNSVLKEILEQQSITAYDAPAVEIANHEPLKLKFTIPTKPVVDLGAYRALRLAEPDPEVISEEKVNEALEQIRRAQATFAPVERPVQMGDQVRLDFKIDAGEKMTLERKDVEREVKDGDTDVVPGFSAALVGMNMGETREFRLTMPDPYEVSELAGATVQCSATIKDIKEVQLPALDDDLAKTEGKFETLAELRDDVRKNLQENADRVRKEQFEADILAAAVNGSKIEFPDVMAEEELNHSIDDVKRSVSQSGFTWENWLRMNNTTEAQMRASMRPGVESRLRNSLFLYTAAEKEGIKIEAPDIDAMIEEEANRFPEDMREQVRDAFSTENSRLSLGLRLLHTRALEKLVAIVKGEGVVLPGDANAARPSEVLVAS